MNYRLPIHQIYFLTAFFLTIAANSSPCWAASAVGTASWYGSDATGDITASGETKSPQAMTAAHRTLEFGTLVKVTNLDNGKSAIVRINDRGPYVKGRIIDVSEQAARTLGMLNDGLAPVRITVLGD